jgi:hypothetical protein
MGMCQQKLMKAKPLMGLITPLEAFLVEGRSRDHRRI